MELRHRKRKLPQERGKKKGVANSGKHAIYAKNSLTKGGLDALRENLIRRLRSQKKEEKKRKRHASIAGNLAGRKLYSVY